MEKELAGIELGLDKKMKSLNVGREFMINNYHPFETADNVVLPSNIGEGRSDV